jgi:DNA-binding beta-propeller fold protein YncE
MKRHITFLLTLMFLPHICFSQLPSSVCVIGTDPASVSIVDLQHQAVTGSVSIDKNPTAALVIPTGHLLYVLHDGSLQPWSKWWGMDRPNREASSLSVIDLKIGKLLRKIPLGWHVPYIKLTADGLKLICLGGGKPRREEPKSDAEWGSITVLDARTADLIFSSAKWRWVQDILWTDDFSRIAVLGVRELAKEKYYISAGFAGSHFMSRIVELTVGGVRPVQHVVSLIDARGEMLSQTDLPSWKGNHPLAFLDMKIALSRDENWLYVLDPGEPSEKASENRDASFYVIDMKSGKVHSSCNLGASPVAMTSNSTGETTVFARKTPKDKNGQVFRFSRAEMKPPVPVVQEPLYLLASETKPSGFWVVGKDATVFLEDQSEIPRNPIMFKDKGSAESGSELLDADIISVIPLFKRNRFALITSDHRVGIVNSDANRLESVVAIGRGGVRSAKLVGRVALAGAAIASPLITGTILAAVGWRPALKNAVARLDEEFLYVVETASNDVTIVDVDKGSVVDKVAIGSDCEGIALSPNGRYLCAFSRTRLTAIDTESNQKHFQYEYPPELGTLKDYGFMNGSDNLALVFDKVLLIWSVQQGKSLTTLKGFKNASMIAMSSEEQKNK